MTVTTAQTAGRPRTPAGAPARFLRTLVIAAAVLGLAAAAHTAAGAALPPPPVMLLLTALAFPPVMALSRHRLNLTALATILTAGQGLLHLAFTGLSGSPGHCTAAGTAAVGHHQAFAIPECAVTGAAAAGHQVVAGTGVAMTVTHALAVLVTAIVLARGEDAVWQLRAWLRPLAGILQPVSVAPGARVPALRIGTIPRSTPHTQVAAPRGPPSRSLRPAVKAV
ncbi:hypothetical protein [Arthrobacter sp. ZGTC131]|uniref:hypothetical protein n=1 Tax=Arthrobacter sp. ZGTC131 TaxID=2058898 RepID=UPI000CE35910|nr:hypothetical protein [Arthrobacter sp. ZGTC131]